MDGFCAVPIGGGRRAHLVRAVAAGGLAQLDQGEAGQVPVAISRPPTWTQARSAGRVSGRVAHVLIMGVSPSQVKTGEKLVALTQRHRPRKLARHSGVAPLGDYW